jgi:hypothetical protein
MRRLAFLVVGSMWLAACGGEDVTPDPDPEPDLPRLCDDQANLTCPSTPTAITTTQIQALFSAECTECHKANCGSASCGSLDLSTVAKSQAAVGKASRYAGSTGLKIVDTGSLANSTLWLKLLGGKQAGCTAPGVQTIGDSMPRAGETLSTEQLNQVKNWICSGAVQE